jgi:hypothetical protein
MEIFMIAKFKSFLGYCIAVLMVPVVMITLMGMGPLAEGLVKLTGVEISPLITGGEVSRTTAHSAYNTRIHRPVFDALIGERREGFVQIVWGPAAALPETIVEDIDYNNDGQADFQVTLHPRTKTAEWKAYASHVLGMDGPYLIGDGMGVRVKLRKQ